MIWFITGLIIGAFGALIGFYLGWARGWRKANHDATRAERSFSQRKNNESVWPGP
jgi:ABC-type lipoprotein release transport system permease subunit